MKTKLTHKQQIDNAFNNGLAIGKDQGRLQGKTEALAIMTNKDKQHKATIDILQAASSFQEGITKLVMSINNHL